jgi:hypothetical protein
LKHRAYADLESVEQKQGHDEALLTTLARHHHASQFSQQDTRQYYAECPHAWTVMVPLAIAG